MSKMRSLCIVLVFCIGLATSVASTSGVSAISGCTKASFDNYDAAATQDDGSCRMNNVRTCGDMVALYDKHNCSTSFENHSLPRVGPSLSLLECGDIRNAYVSNQCCADSPDVPAYSIQIFRDRCYADEVSPVITLNGDSTTNCPSAFASGSSTYVDYDGAVCVDHCDSSPVMTVTNNVNKEVTGTYTVTYTCVDMYGNEATATRTVSVIVDECSAGTHNCHMHATCTDTDAGFNCQCKDGYSGDGVTCSDTNECTEGTHTCTERQDCRDTFGEYPWERGHQGTKFRCVCKDGYKSDLHDHDICLDINECEGTDNCDKNAVCTNTVPGYSCACRDGYTDSGNAKFGDCTCLSGDCDTAPDIYTMKEGYDCWNGTSTCPLDMNRCYNDSTKDEFICSEFETCGVKCIPPIPTEDLGIVLSPGVYAYNFTTAKEESFWDRLEGGDDEFNTFYQFEANALDDADQGEGSFRIASNGKFDTSTFDCTNCPLVSFGDRPGPDLFNGRKGELWNTYGVDTPVVVGLSGSTMHTLFFENGTFKMWHFDFGTCMHTPAGENCVTVRTPFFEGTWYRTCVNHTDCGDASNTYCFDGDTRTCDSCSDCCDDENGVGGTCPTWCGCGANNATAPDDDGSCEDDICDHTGGNNSTSADDDDDDCDICSDDDEDDDHCGLCDDSTGDDDSGDTCGDEICSPIHDDTGANEFTRQTAEACWNDNSTCPPALQACYVTSDNDSFICSEFETCGANCGASTPAPSPPEEPSKQYGLADLLELLGAYGTTSVSSDVDGDGTVDVNDLITLLAKYTGIEKPIPIAGVAVNGTTTSVVTGRNGYDTYQFKIPLDESQTNVYAIFGTSESPVILPKAFQVGAPFGTDTGGVSPDLFPINANSKFDSWLTVGKTQGDIDGSLSLTPQLALNTWSLETSQTIDNGALFLMSPAHGPTEREVIIAQFTVPSGSSGTWSCNAQGKSTNGMIWQKKYTFNWSGA